MRLARLAALALVVCGLAAAAAFADPVAPTFKRGATLVEFFEFPAIDSEGIAKNLRRSAVFRARCRRSPCSISTSCIGSGSIICAFRSTSVR